MKIIFNLIHTNWYELKDSKKGAFFRCGGTQSLSKTVKTFAKLNLLMFIWETTVAALV